MTRTERRKAIYRVSLGLAAAAIGGVVHALHGRHLALFAILAACLVPGRIHGHFYRDLYRGRRLLDSGQPEASLVHTERFLRQIREKPRLKRLMWLAWSTYTVDPEAMALNNIGAANLETGNWDAADEQFRKALALDPEYPIPLFNLAILAEVRKDRAEAERLLREAAERGYRRTSLDGLIHGVQPILARVEGRGVGKTERTEADDIAQG